MTNCIYRRMTMFAVTLTFLLWNLISQTSGTEQCQAFPMATEKEVQELHHLFLKELFPKLQSEIDTLGTEHHDRTHYDTEIRVATKTIKQIQHFLKRDNCWDAGCLDKAFKQFKIKLKPDEREVPTQPFGTVIWVCVSVISIAVVTGAELGVTGRWFVWFRRFFALTLFVGLVYWQYGYALTGALRDDVRYVLSSDWVKVFEDTFDGKLITVVQVCACLALITVTICTELWTTVSWSRQSKRLFVISFLCSILWNWYYLYKAEFASHMAKILQMKNISQKCLGLEEFDWYDNVCAFFRRTFTVQRDPCEEYLRTIVISPLWLVPPNRAISVTFVAFVMDPLERFGEGLNRLIRASIQDLPLLLQLPVLILVILLILSLVFGSAAAWIQKALDVKFTGTNGNQKQRGSLHGDSTGEPL